MKEEKIVKKIMHLLICLVLFGNTFAVAGNFNLPAQPGSVFVLDTSSNNLAATYTTNGQLFTGLTKKSRLSVYNGTTTMIIGCTTSTAANCAAGTDNFIVPPSGTVTVDLFSIGGKICVRSQSGTLSTGLIGAMVW